MRCNPITSALYFWRVQRRISCRVQVKEGVCIIVCIKRFSRNGITFFTIGSCAIFDLRHLYSYDLTVWLRLASRNSLPAITDISLSFDTTFRVQKLDKIERKASRLIVSSHANIIYWLHSNFWAGKRQTSCLWISNKKIDHCFSVFNMVTIWLNTYRKKHFCQSIAFRLFLNFLHNADNLNFILS